MAQQSMESEWRTNAKERQSDEVREAYVIISGCEYGARLSMLAPPRDAWGDGCMGGGGHEGLHGETGSIAEGQEG